MCLIRLSRNAFVRFRNGFVYVENQANHVVMTFRDDIDIQLFERISRQPVRLAELIGSVSFPQEEVKDRIALYESRWFVVTGSDETALNTAEHDFSYASAKEVEQMFKDVPFPDTREEGLWLRSLQVELTSHCNEKCIHCYIPGQTKICGHNMPLDMACRIVDEFAEMGGLRIIFSGGELFLYKHIKEVLSYCRQKDLMIFLQSNMTLVDDAMLDFIKEQNVFNIQVSLYSTDEQVHDSITRLRGSWQKTRTCLEKLVSRDIPALISCPLMQQNYEDYRKMMDYAESIGVFCYVDYIMLAQNDFCTDNVCATRLTLEQTGHLLDEMLDNDPGYRRMIDSVSSREDLDTMLFAHRFTKCEILKNSMCVGAGGDVYPCPAWQAMNIGDLNSQTLEEIWATSEKAHQLRNLDRTKFVKCGSCGYHNYCDMCAVYNYNENNGDLYEPCRRFCEVARMMKNKVTERCRNKGLL